MIAILKSKAFAYGLLVLAFAGLFYLWQHDRNTTKQLEEKSKQLKTIMDNPIVKTVEGPVRIIEGKTIVKTVVVEKKVDGSEVKTETETITEPTIIEKEAVIKEVDYKDPIGEAQAELNKKKYLVNIGYYFSKEVTLNTGMKIFGAFVGPSIKYDINNNDVTAGVAVSFLF